MDKKKPHFLLVGVETGTTILKRHVEIPSKSENVKNLTTQQCHFSVYTVEKHAHVQQYVYTR